MKLINPYLDGDGCRLTRLIENSVNRDLAKGVPSLMVSISRGLNPYVDPYLPIKESLVIKLKTK